MTGGRQIPMCDISQVIPCNISQMIERYPYMPGDRQVPCGVQRVNEHGAEAGVDSLQPSHVRREGHAQQSTQGHQGTHSL